MDLDKYRRIAYCYFSLNDATLDSEELSILNRLAQEVKLGANFSDRDLKLVVDNPNKRIYTVIRNEGNLVYLVDHYDSSFSGSLFTPIPEAKQVTKQEAMDKIKRYLTKKSGN